MTGLGDLLRRAREDEKLILRKVAAEVDIDQSLISKFENNTRRPSKKQLDKLIKFYKLDKEKVLVDWYSDKIAEELQYASEASQILRVSEQKVEYLKSMNK